MVSNIASAFASLLIGVLQLGAGVADLGRVDEDGGNARIDQRGLERANTGHLELFDDLAGGEHRAAAFVAIAISLVGRVDEFQRHLGRGKGHAVELEVAGLLHFAVDDRHVGHDGLADVGLPDAHGARAVARHARRVDQALRDRERPDRGRQVAAVARPVDERAVDGDLAEEVVDVVVRPRGARQDHGLGRGRGGRAHAVDLLGVGVGAADDAQQQRVARRAALACRGGQVLQAKNTPLLVPPRM
jgi:hypothetical protein